LLSFLLLLLLLLLLLRFALHSATHNHQRTWSLSSIIGCMDPIDHPRRRPSAAALAVRGVSAARGLRWVLATTAAMEDEDEDEDEDDVVVVVMSWWSCCCR
jgi:hypothetical protein